MVTSCCYIGCTNRQTKGTTVHFHTIPADPDRRSQWLTAINRVDPKTKQPWVPSKKACVCSVHFKEEDFERSKHGTYLLLKNTAAPLPAKPVLEKMSNAMDKQKLKKANGAVCSYARCKNSEKDRKVKGISFHQFPKNEIRRKRWTHLMRRHESWEPKYHSTICSVHFKESDMDRTGQTVRLRDGVEPSIFPGLLEHLQKEEKSRSNEAVAKRRAAGSSLEEEGEIQSTEENQTKTVADTVEMMPLSSNSVDENDFFVTIATDFATFQKYKHARIASGCLTDSEFLKQLLTLYAEQTFQLLIPLGQSVSLPFIKVVKTEEADDVGHVAMENTDLVTRENTKTSSINTTNVRSVWDNSSDEELQSFSSNENNVHPTPSKVPKRGSKKNRKKSDWEMLLDDERDTRPEVISSMAVCPVCEFKTASTEEFLTHMQADHVEIFHEYKKLHSLSTLLWSCLTTGV